MASTLLLLIAGLALLLVGGELLVRGAVGLAQRAGVTPLVIGLVIVGFGTSTPELVTSVEAALIGAPAIAWGNIVGSNIVNTLLILGASALLAPIVVRRGPAVRDTGVALAASLVLAALALAGAASAWVGGAMIAALAGYIAWCYREERVAEPDIVHNAPYDRSAALELADRGLHPSGRRWFAPVLLALAGLGLLVFGGRMLVGGAIDLARVAGLSETLIGVIIVAVGTSLPELVTSLVAARKGEPEVAFGNVVGSNIYNILGIGGVTMLLAPGAVPETLWPVDLGLMVATALAVVVLALAHRPIGRAAGLALVLGYGGFLAAAIAAQ